MADINIGRALSGLGAAFKNEVPAFLQQVRQEDLDAEKRAEREMFLADRSFDRGIAAEDRAMRLEDRKIAMERAASDRMFELEEKRKETLFKDTAEAKRYLQDGNIMAIIDLYTDRVNLLRNMGIDTSNSERMLSFAQGALSDPNALARLNDEINTVYDTGRAFNVGVGDLGATYRALRQRALDSGEIEGTPGWQQFMRTSGAVEGEGSKGLTRFKNGAYINITPQGPRVYNTDAQEVFDPEAIAEVIRAGRDSGVLLAGDMAAATTRATSQETRIQQAIEDGIDAAARMPKLMMARELLNTVDTGGWDAVKLRFKQAFGITSADESKLIYELSKNVLSQLKPTFGAAFTAKEGDLLMRIEANTNLSTEGNIALLDELINALDLAVQRGRVEARENKDTRSLNAMDGYLAQQFQSLDSSVETNPPPPGPNVSAPNSSSTEDEMRRRGLIP